MTDCNEQALLTVVTTVASFEDAQALARRIVGDRLAACVQVEPIAASFYRWDGRVVEEPEFRVSAKTLPQARPALEALFARVHPYEVPQFIATEADGSAAYIAWVRSEVVLPG